MCLEFGYILAFASVLHKLCVTDEVVVRFRSYFFLHFIFFVCYFCVILIFTMISQSPIINDNIIYNRRRFPSLPHKVLYGELRPTSHIDRYHAGLSAKVCRKNQRISAISISWSLLKAQLFVCVLFVVVFVQHSSGASSKVRLICADSCAPHKSLIRFGALPKTNQHIHASARRVHKYAPETWGNNAANTHKHTQHKHRETITTIRSARLMKHRFA